MVENLTMLETYLTGLQGHKSKIQKTATDAQESALNRLDAHLADVTAMKQNFQNVRFYALEYVLKL